MESSTPEPPPIIWRPRFTPMLPIPAEVTLAMLDNELNLDDDTP